MAGAAMPRIEDFGTYVIRIYPGDHNPPHVHVIAPDFAAMVSIRDPAVIHGNLPAGVERKVLAWCAENEARLAEEWDKYNG